MLFRGKNSQNPLRRRAENLLLCAEKVFRYRGDLFDADARERFDSAVSAVKNALAGTPPDAATLAETADALEHFLCKNGGTIFPQRKIPEWVELIVVAALLAGGIRAFFVQPFKIPTNSMFPTYNGMTAEICDETQNPVAQWAERIFRSASFYAFASPVSGEILIPLKSSPAGGIALPQPEKDGDTGTIVSPGKDIFKLLVRENSGRIATLPIAVPRDFPLSSVFLKTFFPQTENLPVPENARWNFALNAADVTHLPNGEIALRTGKNVRAGENVLNFKILGGDMVLVDRVSYHFAEPARGDPFVFRTRDIPGLNNIELYYIKRLAGKPGDLLRVRDKKLLVNNVPADSAEAFKLNNAPTPEKKYYGYLPTSGAPSIYNWQLTRDFRVPEKYFFALGDNSANSYDSRGWGGVPENAVVGKALFILYPFSARWGFAK